MQERDRVNIMFVILESAKEVAAYDNDDDNIKKTATATNKMYVVLFNNARLKEYWDVLTQEGLLSYNSQTDRFKTTEKGLKFLKACKATDHNMR